MMRVITIRGRITVPGTPILTTTGMIPGGMAVTTVILPGIMATTTVAVTMVMAATMAVAITTLAESDLEPGDGEPPTDDAIPDLGTGGGPDWKTIRKEINLADEYLVDEPGNIEAVGGAREMRDTEEVGDIGVKDRQGRSEIPALRPKDVRSDEAQDEVHDEAHDEE
jgi:hypothetical protein